MQELIISLVTELEISQAQARGGAGALFKAAHDRIGPAQFEELFGDVPGATELISYAPRARGGLLGGLVSMAAGMGGGDAAQAAQLLMSVNSIGIDRDMLMKVVDVVLKYLEAKGGPELVDRVRTAMNLQSPSS